MVIASLARSARLAGVARSSLSRGRGRRAVMAKASSSPISTLYVKACPGNPEERGDCPFCHKAQLYLVEKGFTDYEEKYIDLESKPQWFLDMNPDGKVPFAVFRNDEKMADSQAIIDRVEQEVPEPKITADDDQKQLEEGFLPAFVKFLKGEQDDSAILEKLREIDGYLSKKGTPYLNGNSPGVVDVSLMPKLYHMSIALQHYKNWSMPATYSNVRKYMENFLERESWQRTSYSDNAIVRGWGKHLQ